MHARQVLDPHPILPALLLPLKSLLWVTVFYLEMVSEFLGISSLDVQNHCGTVAETFMTKNVFSVAWTESWCPGTGGFREWPPRDAEFCEFRPMMDASKSLPIRENEMLQECNSWGPET